ncbi:hypothetical protein RHOSPDRAFT_19392 [Rhodotorula sp. JG-1b]|nr:hypothetical protein RHOSPDRAFT_19392 [Rhodotorula sp. JG-1b]
MPVTSSSSSTWTQGRKFGVVIDAGSSGSRVQVYSWLDPEVAKRERHKGGKSVDVLSKVEKGVEHGDGWHLKVEPGISTLGGDPDAVGEYLRPLIEFAASVIPHDQLASTPIYLLATAGMRLLPARQQQNVLSAACSYIRDAFPFHLPDCDQQIRIISGEEEGLYGWIAVNYLMDGFDKHEQHADDGGGRRKLSSTYGFLDMGGASTQIAFEPSAVEQVKHADNLHQVHLRLLSGKDVKHPVFVTTWLGFGTNQARSRYIDQEVERHVRTSTSASLPQDDDDDDAAAALVDDPCLPKGLMLPDARHTGVTLHGTGDFVQCLRRQAPLLNKEAACTDEPCLFDGVHVPPIDFSVNHFIGISEYWYSTQDVWGAALGNGGVYDYVAFEKHAIEFCGRDWQEILREHQRDGAPGSSLKASVELSRLETQCFKAAWIVNVLHEGIGIPRIIDRGGKGDGKNQTEKGISKAVDKHLVDEPPHFQSLNEVDDVAISWTLGKMVLEVSRGSTELPTLDIHHHPSGVPPTPLPLPIGPSYEDAAGKEEWAGHTPSWKSDIRTTIATIKDSPVLPVVAFFAALTVIWLFGLGPGAARRRKSVCGPRSPRRANFSLLPTTDALDDAVAADALVGEGTPSRDGRKKNGGRILAPPGRLFFPIRSVANRATSYLRSVTRPRSGGMFRSASTGNLLPMSRVPQNPPEDSSSLFRPRPLRPSKSTPFLRNALVSSTSTSTTSLGAGGEYWNDTPTDLPMPERDRSRGASLRVDGEAAPFQRSISSHAVLTEAGQQRHASPPPMAVIPPSGLSRPTTPTARSSLTRLTPRGTPTRSDHGDSLRVVTSGSSSGVGAPSPLSASAVGSHASLSSAIWDSLSAGQPPHASRERDSTSPTPGVTSPTSSHVTTGGAKLRPSRSQNNSQVNLAGGYFGASHAGTGSARRSGVTPFAVASASSTSLGAQSAASTPGTGD